MKAIKRTCEARLGIALLLCLALGTASAQFVVHQPTSVFADGHAGVMRALFDWHEFIHDADNGLFSMPQSIVKVQERITTDENQTSHLNIAVHERSHCKEATPVKLSDVRVSVLDDELTVEANSTRGNFVRNYKLPEHALPDQITAVLTTEKALHIICPTDAPKPRLVHVVVEEQKAPGEESIKHAESEQQQAEQSETDASKSRADVADYIASLEAELAKIKTMI